MGRVQEVEKKFVKMQNEVNLDMQLMHAQISQYRRDLYTMTEICTELDCIISALKALAIRKGFITDEEFQGEFKRHAGLLLAKAREEAKQREQVKPVEQTIELQTPEVRTEQINSELNAITAKSFESKDKDNGPPKGAFTFGGSL